MTEKFIAFDLGAESARAIVGTLFSNKYLEITELHRFPNSIVDIEGNLYWDVHRLYTEMLKSLQICAIQYSDSPMSIGVDTWGVDFGLLDKNGDLIGMPFAYRDKRTHGMMDRFFKIICKKEIYERTGVQFMQINTLYQLYSLVATKNPQLKTTKDLLFIPDIFNYFLTGIKKSEFTFATTSQLYNPRSCGWDREIFSKLDISMDIMQEIVQPGTVLGELTDYVVSQTDIKKIPVIAVATHDTGSAVAAVPASGDDFAYISSGTWSLMGIESDEPIINEKTYYYNFTNEGGVCKTFRILKNIMGLWIMQECRKIWSKDKKYSYEQLIEMAAHAPSFYTIIDPNSVDFLRPDHMPLAIEDYCKKTGQNVPRDIGQFVRCIFESLALSYRDTLIELCEICDRKIEHIHIIGGGSQNCLLCQFTANATGLPVYAGPVEATAVGNIMMQTMALGKISSLSELRDVVRSSFSLSVYRPERTKDWDAAYKHFSEVKQREED